MAVPVVGDRAPEFALRDQHGRTVSLADFRGDRHVVIVFYPYAFSRVCSSELAALRDEWPPRDDAVVLAVSCDPMFALRAFAEAERLELPLLSDFWPHGAVASAYGVFDERAGCARRSTFVVDRQGLVRWAVHSPMGESRDLSNYVAVLDSIEE